MRRHILDYVRCALCKKATSRDECGGWVELSRTASFLGMFDFPLWKRNICPECRPRLGWPYSEGITPGPTP